MTEICALWTEVFSAFRLLRYLLPAAKAAKVAAEALGSSVPFGYCGICYIAAILVSRATHGDGLQCLSAIAVFVTRRE